MGFDWKKYLNLANELSKISTTLGSDQEAIQRTIISRAYYSAFIQARNFLRDKDKTLSPNRAKVHQLVIEQFEKSSDPMRVQIGKTLGKLRILRNLADYDDVVWLLNKRVQKSLVMAEDIILDLEKL